VPETPKHPPCKTCGYENTRARNGVRSFIGPADGSQPEGWSPPQDVNFMGTPDLVMDRLAFPPFFPWCRNSSRAWLL